MSELLPPGSICRSSVPGSTSNLGPGFDTIGCALNVRNEFELQLLDSSDVDCVEVSGPYADGIVRDSGNIVLRSAKRLFDTVGVRSPALSLAIVANVPNSRGLGSSATAIVGGVMAANGLLREPLLPEQVLALAVEIEGHPDNVAPAMLGGMIVFATESNPLSYLQIRVHADVSFVFVIPDYEVETAEARRVLPKSVPFDDAVFNASRTPHLVHALHEGKLEYLAVAMEDRLHQPYRRPLYRAYNKLRDAAIDAGASGFCVSGAGPTMLAVCHRTLSDKVRAALQSEAADAGIGGEVRELIPENTGARQECVAV